MASEPKFVSKGDRITASWANDVVGTIRQSFTATARQPLKGGGGGAGPCPFGETFLDAENQNKQSIKGGFVFVGDKNHFLEKYDLKMDDKRDAFIYVKIPCKVNVDDDGQLLLPNVETDNGNPTFEENATNVPDNENPSVPSGTGVVYVPVAKLTLKEPTEEGGTATMTLEFFECGNIRAEHCAGTLSYTRNNLAPTIPQ